MHRTTAALVAALAFYFLAALPCAAQPSLILSTTTSTQDSGLLDDLLPRFEKATGIRVKTIAVGSGEALAMGRRGDADVLLVHSKAAEDEFMAQGFGSLRLDVMHNDFVLVGPPKDPAGVKGLATADALRQIAGKGALFASRDDRSGTHARELDLWKRAGVDPHGKPWYIATGQGMGETLTLSNEKGAYTLSDRATWLAQKSKLPNLAIVVGGTKIEENADTTLFNPYGVIPVNPAKHPNVNRALAEKFALWLTSPETQKLIASFGVDKFGQSLFKIAGK